MERNVHLIPLGWEVDRAILPLEAVRPHRVYILCDPESHPWQAHYYNQVVERLKAMNVEYRHVRVDSVSDMKGLVRELAHLMKQEIESGNRVFVNISSAGKIGAVASTLVTMAHMHGCGRAYYVRPEEYVITDEARMVCGLTKGMKGEPIDVPIFPIWLPSREGSAVLLALKQKGGSMKYYELFRVLAAKGVEGYVEVTSHTSRKVKTNLTVRLTKTILKPLHEQGLVTSRKEGRTQIVSLTDAGDFMACLLG
jgi:hypothetical protein